MPTLDIAYGEAGWNVHSSFIGNFSLGTRPNTSDEAHTCIIGFKFNKWTLSNNLAVPKTFVFSVSIGAVKLVKG